MYDYLGRVLLCPLPIPSATVSAYAEYDAREHSLRLISRPGYYRQIFGQFYGSADPHYPYQGAPRGCCAKTFAKRQEVKGGATRRVQ